MKHLAEALQEYKKTSPLLKPLLCLIPEKGLYIVTLVFSEQFAESKGLKVIKFNK